MERLSRTSTGWYRSSPTAPRVRAALLLGSASPSRQSDGFGAFGPPLTRRVARLLRLLRGSSEPVELSDALSGPILHYFTEGEMRREVSEDGLRLPDHSQRADAVGEAV